MKGEDYGEGGYKYWYNCVGDDGGEDIGRVELLI